MEKELKDLIKQLKIFSDEERIEAINKVKIELHKISPLKNEPVDCILWVKNSMVKANDYNPNNVAPPEMELLRISIMTDGYTQPIVTMKKGEEYEVVDGFHRSRVGKELEDVRNRVKNYLPLTIIREDREEKGDRIAATIRHNRARGKHTIDGMSEIILELKRRNWSDKKIGRELGMEPDEVLRLAQITGLREVFKDEEFSLSWEIGEIEDIKDLEDVKNCKEEVLENLE